MPQLDFIHLDEAQPARARTPSATADLEPVARCDHCFETRVHAEARQERSHVTAYRVGREAHRPSHLGGGQSRVDVAQHFELPGRQVDIGRACLRSVGYTRARRKRYIATAKRFSSSPRIC